MKYTTLQVSQEDLKIINQYQIYLQLKGKNLSQREILHDILTNNRAIKKALETLKRVKFGGIKV